ncbi:HlyD family efflux transporter periplasmic adaptor subunit [Halobacillus seohaensis]|uniref:HlyD family efflux transporter periplasmic adaptor subunit n=1 Tax=Halobacillus seohaensis TaxID=447421 RepID=A0ABW2ETA2_9BACI
MKNKNRWIGLGVFLFLACNFFLIYFDSDHNVEQKSYVNEWSGTFSSDIEESLSVRGVFSTEEVTPVYFDEQSGSFQEFFVDVGDQVNNGDELYSYEVLNYQSQEAELERESTKLQEEIDAIDTYLLALENYTIDDSQNNNTFGFNNPFSNDDSQDEVEGFIDNNQDPAEAELIKEEAIADKEKERTQKEAKLAMVEDQLDQLTSTGQTITVTSTFDGVVTDRSEDLNSPLLTLSSSELLVEGKLREKERKMVEEDMKAEITIQDLDDLELQGSMEEIDSFPEDVNVHSSSQYPYEITLTENDEQIRAGYHADVNIITDEVSGALAAFEKVLVTEKNLFAWKMTDQGILEKSLIETGLEEAGIVEISSGLEGQVKLASLPRDQFRDGTPFITPIDLRNLKIDDLFQGSLPMKETILLGLFNR